MEWIVESSATLVNTCLVGRDGKAAYSRSMGKDSCKGILERVFCYGREGPAVAQESVLAQQVGGGLGRHRQAVERGPVVRCRTVRRRLVEHRWSLERVVEIKATPRKPNPEDKDNMVCRHREHGQECRARIEEEMARNAEDLGRLIERDLRLKCVERERETEARARRRGSHSECRWQRRAEPQ